MSYSTYQLEKIKIGMVQILDRYLFDSSVTVLDNIISNRIEFQLQGFIWGDESKEYKATYPSDWKQAFKERWFPNWAKKKWPVVYTNFVVSARNVYPDLKISVPQERHIVILSNYSFDGFYKALEEL